MPTDFEDLDEFEDETEEPDDNQETPPVNRDDERVAIRRKDAKRATAAIKRNKELERELAALRRKEAMAEAKIDLSSPQGQFFLKHYDADETDPAKLREAAEAAGVPVLEDATQKGPDLKDGEQHSTDERQSVATGGTPDDGQAPRKDPHEEGLRIGKETVAKGGTETEGIAASIASKARAVMEGDDRATVKPFWEQTG